MDTELLIAIIGFVGGIIAAISPQIYKSISERKGLAYVRDIRGRWVADDSNGSSKRIHTLVIENQAGREVSGYRVLSGDDKPTRKYFVKGFFSGDLLSASIIHEDQRENRNCSILLRVETSELMKGKVLQLKNGKIQVSNDLDFIKNET